MHTPIRTNLLFYTFTLLMCFHSFFLMNTPAQVADEPVATLADDYTFETIEVEGVQFLAVTSSSDFEDYGGYTQRADDGKTVAFTLIDGVFMTYDFPDSQETRFYALGNNGNAAGYYVDSEGHHRGVVLENGELRGYDFPDSVQTQIWGISDATGKLTGNFIDASGVRRGFTGNEIIEFPGASETFADFINSQGGMVGSYVDAEGLYQPYVRTPSGRFISLDLPRADRLEYFFVHGINDAQTIVSRTKTLEGDLLTYVGRFQGGLQDFKVPGSVSTEGYNINQDGSIVGNYVSSDGRTHGFIARPAQDTDAPVDTESVIESAYGTYTFETIDVPGTEILVLTASSDFEDYAGNTKSADGEKIVGFTLIDGVFTIYDFPGAKNTYFYALGNDGRAAGHYEDSEGLHHGVVLENGELQQYDFPGAVQTEIYGISDATGALTGNFIDASGVRRGFSGDTIIEIPNALATFADFVNASGVIVGSYIDADGIYRPYYSRPDGRFTTVESQEVTNREYFFVHGISDAGISVARVKSMGDVPRTYVGRVREGSIELQFPGAVSTEGWNINQDGSIVGNYESPDGRRHGFIARPAQDTSAQVDAEPVPTPSAAQVSIEPIPAPEDSTYTFESIDVSGVQFLAVTSSSDYEDYGGYTQQGDDEKIVAFTLIDGVFMTYDFPDAQETRFYALGNNGNAAGYYVDSEGHHRGVVLENGEMRQYDFPDSVQTEIWGISDATGALTGNFTDDSGVRRGFTGDEIIEAPGASETFADFVNSQGGMVGSYVDAEGLYHPYVRAPGGRFVSLDLPRADKLEYFFVHGINDAQTIVSRAKAVDDVPVTHVGTFQSGLRPFKVPGSVSTEGYNINQDGSIVGNYVSPDGRTHGFIARPAQDADEPVVASTDGNHYTFQTVDVPGTEILVLTASSDFEDYAGNSRGADGEKEVGFTLIDGVFTTYDVPGSQNTYFYALGNDGRAAGHYEDSEGLHHGVVLENGELQQYDFPNAVETEIYGISDATGALTGNFIDASGVRRGFSGDTIVEVPGASATFADFVNADGTIVGSYIDAEGLYHPYYMRPDGRFITIDDPDRAANREYLFVHGINDAGSSITRVKLLGDVPRTYVGRVREGSIEVKFPGAVSTEGWNINQDGSIVGNYVSPDGRRHGFIARPASQAEAESYSNAYTVTLSKGLNMLSVPLAPPKPMTAKSLVALAGATTILTLDAVNQRFVAWTPGAPDDGFAIEGGKGYIVNVPQARNFAFAGAQWTNQTETAPAAPTLSTQMPQEAWAFVVSGHLEGKPTFDGYQVSVRNLRTNRTLTAPVQGDYFAAATADLTRRSVVQAGDTVEVRVLGPDGNLESQTLTFKVTPQHLANAVLSVSLEGIGQPTQDLLLQNYPNPFNPETWIPYQLSEDSAVSISIYDTTGRLVRTLSLGFQSAGFYNSRSQAAYWDGRNELGERVASGIYFYQLTTPTFQQTRRLVILK